MSFITSKIKALSVGIILLASSLAFSQKVTLPSEVKVDPSTFTVVTVETDCPNVKWVLLDPGLSLIPPALLKDGKSAVLMGVKAGKYRILCYGAKGDAASEPAICTVIVGTPVPPTPDPGPGPNPDPTPNPNPDPFLGKTTGSKVQGEQKASGLRVLIKYESQDLNKYPASQTGILYSQSFRDYLDSKCLVGSDGKTKDWRMYDKDVDLTNESEMWQKVMKRPSPSLPWIVIGNGKTGYEGPLPKTVDESTALVKKYVIESGKQ